MNTIESSTQIQNIQNFDSKLDNTIKTYKEKLSDLSDLLSKYDPFYKDADSKKVFWYFDSELQEVKEEYENNNYEELEKELWDIYWNFLFLMNKLSDEWKIEKDKVYKLIYEKISKRKAFLIEEREVNKKEAMEI